jgi:hypothetical protein
MNVTDYDPAPTSASDLPASAPAMAGGVRLRSGDLVARRYRVDHLLGRGASADVWRADDLRLGRPVALKVFRNPQGGEYDSPQRRSAEAQLLAGMNNRHLVAVYDAGGFGEPAGDPGDGRDDAGSSGHGDDHGVGWIAMELVDGRTLRSTLQDGPLSLATVAAIGRQLADVLGYVHRRGAVHRDVKPANVLLTSTEQSASSESGGQAPLHVAALDPALLTVKLTDFGIARLLDAARLTTEGATVGTANYLSPEQVTGTGWGAPVDVYALGLLLLESLTGEIAFPGHGVEAAVARLHRPPDIPSWLPADWRSLLTAMTALEPAGRPQAADVAAALAAITTDAERPLAAVASLGAAGSSGSFGLVPGLHADDTAATTIVSLRDGQRRRRLPVLVGVAGAAAAAAIIYPLAFAGGPASPDAGAATAPSTSASSHVPAAAAGATASGRSAATSTSGSARRSAHPKLAAATPVAQQSRAAAAATRHAAHQAAHPASHHSSVPVRRTPARTKAAPPNAHRPAASHGHHGQPAPAKGGPHKAAPAKGGPHKAAPAKGGPHKAAPAKGGPHKAAPAKGGPHKAAPAKRGPHKAAPAKRGPLKDAPAKAAPRQDPQ